NQGIFEENKKIFTKNKEEYRFWNPAVSKLSAALHKGLKQTFLKQRDVVLYLGASTGTTTSHISDIVGDEGFIFAVEISPTVCRELVFLAEERQNIAPILADANQPQTYADKIQNADWMYQDIAQKNQAEIFVKNLRFLKTTGYAFLVIKARSINVVKEPKQIFEDVRKELIKYVEIMQEINLAPYKKDHIVFVCRKIKNGCWETLFS
ncbi:fibrillarin-like rRNA/tRNA 2'-O-methyltransferase, partial [Candidatus Woesearchaeota archaeon]|nr:fibrillarin-like rRNA/tRNA 2'-O-methyltransferase [Candidatus Woesearchaeota archaeon]